MIPLSEYQARRQELGDAMPQNSVCVVAAATEVTRSRDTEYQFRQDSDFWYLTGFNEPDSWLVISNKNQLQVTLFCRPKDNLAEIWQGRRLGVEQAIDKLGVEQAHSIEELEDTLPDLLEGHDQVYFSLGDKIIQDEVMLSAIKELRDAPKQSRNAPDTVVDLRPLLHEMRLIKRPLEIAVMQKAADISCRAHERAMRFAGENKFEYQLEAELHHEFAMAGARAPAYGTIVGSGNNACILHYTENSSPLKNGDLVLIDAGAELDGYASDITRTFPVSGKFSEEQSLLYDLVLKAQLESMELLIPGNTLKQATDKAIEVLTQGLLDLDILKGNLQDNIEAGAYKTYFMHGLGHWLGLDVHDVGDYKIDGKDRLLKPGMVLTVEPGLYIAPDAECDAKWCGIGIRIEDNVLITETGHQVLTEALVKTQSDIENLMQTSPIE